MKQKKIHVAVTLLLAASLANAANDGVNFDGVATNSGVTSGSTAISISSSTGTAADAAGGGVAIGDASLATGGDAVSIGVNAAATNVFTTAVGRDAKATGGGSTSLGSSSTASGDVSVAVGGARATSVGAISIGNGAASTQANTISVGQSARAVQENATAIGYSASALGTDSLAIGANAITTGINSVSLGSNSQNFEDNTISVGSDVLQRRITNVADGINATDVATVGQASTLATNAANAAVTAATPGIISSATGLANAYTDTSSSNTLNSANTYTDAAVSLIDTTNLLKLDGTRSMTGNLQMGGQSITGLADGLMPTDASTVGQMQNYANSLIYQSDGITTGQMSILANQASLTVTNELGNTHGIVVDTTKTVISGGTTSTSLTLDDSGATLATVATGAPAQLHGVADGTAPNDAVNVKQLTDAIASFTGGGGVGAVEINRLDGRIDRLEGKIKEIAKKAYGGTALSMALAAPTPVQAGQVQMGFGIGNFNGESALAVNVSRATETGNAVVSFGGGFTSAGDIGFRGAIAWAWDPEVSSK